MKLLIDQREGDKIKSIAMGCGCDARVVQLPLGDFLIVKKDKAVVVERKSVSDFVSSVRSNRLWEQLLRLFKAEQIEGYQIKRKILLIHGSFNDYPLEGNKFLNSVMGAMLEAIFVYGIPIVMAEDDNALKAFLRILIQREETGQNAGLPKARWFRRPAPSELPMKDRKLYVLESLPLVGEHLSRSLLNHFGTVAKVAVATPEALMEVPDIGEKRAAMIYEVFH
jgi:ERCC4-type nuclease